MEFLNIVYVIAVILFSHEAVSNHQQELKEIQDPSPTTSDYFSGGVERVTPVLYRIPLNSTGQPREISASAPRRLLPKKLDFVLLRHRKQSLRMRVHRMRDVLGSHTRVEWTEGEEMESRVLSSRCIYHGKVDEMESSQATVDLCNDIRGVIRTDFEDIYLEPMTDASRSFDDGGIKDDDNSNNGTHFIRIHRRSGEGKVDDELSATDDHVINLTEDTTNSHTITHNNGTDGENSDRSSSSDRHHRRRQKRQTPHRGPRHMQVLLVTDSSLVRFHGRNLIEQYLLTQMSIVDSIYHHPSLGFEVNMIVVKIKIIDDSVVRRLVVRGDGKESLDRFCQWANNEKPKTRNRDEDFDVAVYITKEEIGPAGFAPVTGMCVPLRSCALVKDDGTSSAFVIAHEIGHIFGMIHDGHGNKCTEDTLDGNIMASMVQSNFHTYYWTQCNKEAMEKYLVDVHCLDDRPKDPLWPVYSQPFGQSWNLDEQCRQEFGAGFSLCRAFDHLDPCIHLWCSHSSNTTLCKTKRGPPLPGTSCGRGKWCMNGSCLEKRSVAVDGGWSTWQKWGECSRTCGIGIQFRVRYCNQPRPKHGGRDCRGDREEFRTCNIQGCPHLKDFRAEQCAEYNDKRFDGSKRHNWQPHENKNASEMCKVTCISEETKTIFVSESNAVDGTFCSYDQTNNQVCVKGRCETVGCDGALNSRQREDQCGNCGGNGASCKRVSGYFTDPLSKQEYHRLLVVPPGARNIMITERQSMPHLAHFIAVRDSKTEAWYLNGNTHQEQSRHFVVHGTSFTYSNKQRDGETLTAKGPLLSPLDIMVYSMSSKLRPVIDYEYAIPANHPGPIEKLTGLTPHSANSSRYVWAVSGWTNCSKPCGSGIQFEVFSCVDTEKRSYSDGFCSQLTKPREGKQECNTKECSLYTYWWDADDWSAAPPCSASCGTHGVQQRRIQCVTDNKGQTKAMSPGYCNQRLMPNYVQPCNRFPCTTEAPTLPHTSTASLAPTTPSTPERQTLDTTTPAVKVSHETSESSEVQSSSRNPQEHDVEENSEERDLGIGQELHLRTKMADSVPEKLTSRSTEEPAKVSSSLGLVLDENNGRRISDATASSSLEFLFPRTTATTTPSRSLSPTDRRFTSEAKWEPTSATVTMKLHGESDESDDFANSIESELGKVRPIVGKTGQGPDGKPIAAAELLVTTHSPNKHPDPVTSRYRVEKTEHEVPKILETVPPSPSPSAGGSDSGASENTPPPGANDVREIKDSMNSTGFQRQDPSTRVNASSSSSSSTGDTVARSNVVPAKVRTTITRKQSRSRQPVSLHLGPTESPLHEIRLAAPPTPPPPPTSPSLPPTSPSPPPTSSPSTSPPSTSPPPTSPPPTTVTTPAADDACLEDRSIIFCQAGANSDRCSNHTFFKICCRSCKAYVVA